MRLNANAEIAPSETLGLMVLGGGLLAENGFHRRF